MPHRLLLPVVVLVALAGCASTPPSGPRSTDATPSGRERMAAFGCKTAW